MKQGNAVVQEAKEERVTLIIALGHQYNHIWEERMEYHQKNYVHQIAVYIQHNRKSRDFWLPFVCE